MYWKVFMMIKMTKRKILKEDLPFQEQQIIKRFKKKMMKRVEVNKIMMNKNLLRKEEK